MKYRVKHCSICGGKGHSKQRHTPVPKEKICFECMQLLPIEDFYTKERTDRCGYISYASRCKTCDVENQNKRFNSSPEKRAVVLWNSAKSRCKKEGIPFSITTEDIVKQYRKQNGECYYSGQPMSPIAKSPTLMSIDRIDSTLGYTKDNIVLCCWQVNDMKNNYSQPEFLSLCKQIYDFSNNRRF